MKELKAVISDDCIHDNTFVWKVGPV